MTTATANDFIYDLETFKHLFTAGFVHAPTRTRFIFEISDRVNQGADLMTFLFWLRDMRARGVGFNNEGFDYVVLHDLIQRFQSTGYVTALDAYDVSQRIIDPMAHAVAHALVDHTGGGYDLSTAYSAAIYLKGLHYRDVAPALTSVGITNPVAVSDIQLHLQTSHRDNRFGEMIWPDQRHFQQVDLYKIHHFDNMAKSTGLKKLEIAMRSISVIDTPTDYIHRPLTDAEMDETIVYMCHDISETLKFYWASKDAIDFRDELAAEYPDLGDVMNFNDTKIGKKLFERELELASPGICYTREGGRKAPRQTIRSSIALGEVISPKVIFRTPEFEAIRQRLAASVIVETKGVFEDMKANVGGIDFVFGVGGIHGSVHNRSVYPDADHDLIDVDVASYYPNLAITNRFYPEHLSELFCDINKQLFDRRIAVGKKTVKGGALKLALNGVYGDSGNVYGPFFDTKYMMSITINGQLLLCMLAEWCMGQGAQMIQVNTDGITCLVRKDRRADFMQVCGQWEHHTGLELEYTDYSAMHIRDVNNYMAVKAKDGSVKRIGAYAYVTPLEDPATRELNWHKNHSNRVVAMAAEAYAIRGTPIADFIMNHRDPFDFMGSIKVPRNARLEQRFADGRIEPVQNITRYYVSTSSAAGALTKIMAPLAKNPGVERVIGIEKGWTVKIVNDARLFDWNDVNWLYYIEEAKKLVPWLS